MNPPTPNLNRLMGQLAHLAGLSATPAPSVTRVLYTSPDLEARAYLHQLAQEAGFALHEDALGNLFVRWEGSEPALPAVGTGSHTDAIPHAGAYDGVVGVLGGLEAMRSLQEAGFRPRRSLELLVFTSEEPTRFGLGCLGSRALSGALSPHQLRQLHDDEGISLDEARQQAGFVGPLEGVPLSHDHYAAFVELHIEQGPLLEQAGLPLGVVEAIAAPATLHLEFNGNGGHAGALLMPYRHDALLAAAEVALAAEQAALATGAIDSVATCGRIENHPNAVNSVPKHTLMQVDVRDIQLERRDQMVAQIQQAAQQICQRRGVELRSQLLNADPPATCSPQVVEAVVQTALQLNIPHQRMVSRAYHDSLFMARLAPTAMIFIPCRGGVSHRPDEYAEPAHIALGIQVLAGCLQRLSMA